MITSNDLLPCTFYLKFILILIILIIFIYKKFFIFYYIYIITNVKALKE